MVLGRNLFLLSRKLSKSNSLRLNTKFCAGPLSANSGTFRNYADKRAIQNNVGTEEESPVVIIGGGPTALLFDACEWMDKSTAVNQTMQGLILSILLSQYNIPSTLVEARTPDQIHMHPQAHYLNLRTMEILKHYVPNAFEDVINAMPPVDDWEGFTFGYSVMGKQIARVAHPVRDIVEGQDGNSILCAEVSGGESTDNTNSSATRCSVCNPGHLAQNKFASILLKETRRMADLVDGTKIYHGESVLGVKEQNSQLQVQTNARNIKARHVIVAEGSLSQTRSQHGGILAGNTEMQHLMNIHFRTSERLSNQLEQKKEAVGMLHFVFNQEIVGAFVCHDLREGEWVLQVPFFPPYQNSTEFGKERVQNMVKAGLAGESIVEVQDNDIEILSVKPWTMSATVAQKYLIGESNNIILAGDAAHAFPPAGGFGMNTGIQDSHNLAWRLASIITERRSKEHGIRMLEHYETDRKPIAQQNAALSVRNYNRTLAIAKACYLDADHPSLLKKVMDLPPMNFIPFNIRQQTFGKAVMTAMIPLANIASGNLYGNRITKNVRRILESGGGLPLLFPRFEIGFNYDKSRSLNEEDDTAAFYSQIGDGNRLPHVAIKVVAHPSNTCDAPKSVTSLTDIESQISGRWAAPNPPNYSLILSCPKASNAVVSEARMWAEAQVNGAPLRLFELYSDRVMAVERAETLPQKSFVLYDIKGKFDELKIDYIDRNGYRMDAFLALLVRPDGHIARVKKFENSR